jgi:hypothetical protein
MRKILLLFDVKEKELRSDILIHCVCVRVMIDRIVSKENRTRKIRSKKRNYSIWIVRNIPRMYITESGICFWLECFNKLRVTCHIFFVKFCGCDFTDFAVVSRSYPQCKISVPQNLLLEYLETSWIHESVLLKALTFASPRLSCLHSPESNFSIAGANKW